MVVFFVVEVVVMMEAMAMLVLVEMVIFAIFGCIDGKSGSEISDGCSEIMVRVVVFLEVMVTNCHSK